MHSLFYWWSPRAATQFFASKSVWPSELVYYLCVDHKVTWLTFPSWFTAVLPQGSNSPPGMYDACSIENQTSTFLGVFPRGGPWPIVCARAWGIWIPAPH